MRNIVGMMRVKNEGRWIVASVRSLLEVCSGVIVFDDCSTDGTPQLAAATDKYRVKVVPSPFGGQGLDEVRDKNFLLKIALDHNPTWILHIDGDEVLEPKGAKLVEDAIDSGAASSYALQVVYFWNDLQTIRTDGIYHRFTRPSLFSARSGRKLEFKGTRFGGNFHCGNVPDPLAGEFETCRARLKHYGYLDASQRVRKFHFYNEADPDNLSEDHYRHMVQGDVAEVPAGAVLKHAGPLKLTPWID